jgi:hypothetical protein
VKGLLIALQAIGAVTLIPYPAVLLANVMSIAAPGQTLIGAIPFILLTIYPAVWIGLYALAWRAMLGGSAGVAFALSSIPALAGLGAVALFVGSDRGVTASYAKVVEETRARIEPVNPLVWTILCSGGPNRLPAGPKVSTEEVLKAIETHPALLNVPVIPEGTPLRVALMNTVTNLDGTLGNDTREPTQHQQDMMRIVRSLVAHGAHLKPEEMTLWRSWQLRRIRYEGPVTTKSENPLVWRIVQRKRFEERLAIRKDELPFINKPTRLHGTPMYAALLASGFYILPELLEAGARLSPEEERDPEAAKALKDLFEKRPDVRPPAGH